LERLKVKKAIVTKLIICCVLGAATPGAFGEVPESVAAFFGSTLENPKLSPDGEHFGVIRTVEGHDFIEIFRLADTASVGVVRMERGQGILDYWWVDEETLGFIIRSGDPFFGAFPTGAMSYNITDEKYERMFRNARRPNMGSPAHRLSMTDYVLPNAFDGSSELRLTMRSGLRGQRDSGGAQGRSRGQSAKESIVFRYDVVKEGYKEIAKLPGEVFTTYSHRDGRVLAAFGYQPKSSTADFRDQVQLVYRRDSDDEFKIAKTGHVDAFEVYLIADGPTKDTVYVLEDITGDTLALSILDLKTGSIEFIFRPARTDLMKAYLDGNRQLYAVRYDDHFPQYHYPNPKNKAAGLHNALSERFKDKNVEFTDFSADNSKIIVFVSSDFEPGTYYVLDRKSNKLSTLFERDEDEAKLDLGPRNPIEFEARDATRLTGYMTLPKGHTKGRLPLIVLPHDEQFAEPFTWGYDTQAQFFATHGFAVIQINQIGTLGFGRKFHDAGVGEFGGARLDDLAAGIKFAVDTGAADKDRVCVVGHRWGSNDGFMSAIRNQNLYACVVTANGDYDLSKTYRDISGSQFRNRYATRLAGEDADAAAVGAVSPHMFAGQIASPLLLVEGKQFRSALYPNTSRMVERLRQSKANWQIHEESTTRMNNLLTGTERMNAYARILEFVTEHTTP